MSVGFWQSFWSGGSKGMHWAEAKQLQQSSYSPSTSTRDSWQSFVRLSPEQEFYEGIFISGTNADRRRVKTFISKYIKRGVIGEVISSKLREVEVKPSSDMRAARGTRLGRAFSSTGRIFLASDLSNDRFDWVFGHELGHLYGYEGTQEGEVRCDDFADRFIYRRPQYRYTEARLKDLPSERSAVLLVNLP